MFKQKHHEIGPLLERADAIRERFVHIWGNSRQDITTPLARLVDEIRAAAAQIIAIESTNESAVAIGALIGACDEGFDEIAIIIARFNIQTKTTVSFTYLAETKAIIDRWYEYHKKYQAGTASDEIYTRLVARLLKMSPIDVETEYSRYPRATALYARYLTEAGPEVADLIERAKTNSIVAVVANFEAPPPSSRDMWPLQRFGLVPRKQHMTPGELAIFLLGQSNASGITTMGDFITTAQAKKINVLSVTMLNGNPVEYDTSRLTDSEAAKGYVFPVTAGINKRILERFANVRHYPASQSGCEFGVRRFDHAPGGKWVVVRTLNGEHWDAMADSMRDLYVDERVVDRIIRGPSPRIAAYNQLKSAAFRDVFRAMPNIADQIKAENKSNVETLTNRITGRIVQYIDKSLTPLPTNPVKLEDAINDPKFVEIMSQELIASYSDSGISTDVPADEFVSTFIADVDGKIMVQFARNLKSNMIELSPGAKIFREYSGETLRTRLYNLFVDIIKQSVTSALRTKENIYDKLLIKDAALRALDM